MAGCVPRSRAIGLGWLVLLLGELVWASAAQAEEARAFADYARSSMWTSTSLLPFRVDAHAALTWEADVGAGLRLDIPILNRARHHSSRDELALSLGADVSFVNFDGSERLTTWPTVMGQWTLAVSERFSLYPELGLVARVERRDFKGIYPSVGFGVRVRLYKVLALMGRLGWPIAVSIGITF